MYTTKKSWRWGLGLLLSAVTLTAVYSAGGQVGGGGGRLKSVVTVNLVGVLEKLDQRADAQANLATMASSLQSEQTQKLEALRRMEKELNELPEGAARNQLESKLRMAAIEYQGWERFSAEKLDIERSLILQDLYRSIKAAIANLAAAARYDLVLVDDSQGELTLNSEVNLSREAQIRQQIANRRILYVNAREIDITQDLIDRMNNAFKAAGPGG